jgi:hypothetical protein
VFDKLGKDYTRTVYWLKDNRVPVQITDPAEEGKFFAESVYVIDIKGSGHRYLICWIGGHLVGEQLSTTSEAMDDICEHINTSDMTRMRVKKGHETEELLRFFPKGFIILDEARVPLSEFYKKVDERGAMFRIQAPFGSGARAIELNDRAAKNLNSGDAYVVFLHGMF